MTMRYATSVDVGESKRPGGVNEDSVVVAVFEQCHRDGYRERTRETGPDGSGSSVPATGGVAAFALADGAGGEAVGDVASYVASTAVCEELAGTAARLARCRPDAFGVSDVDVPETPSAVELRDEVAEAIERAHDRVVADAAGYTTIVAGIAAGGQVHLGWVGDSRAYVVNGARGDIAQLTRDHTVVERLRELGDVDDVEARVHPRGNEITRALGGTGEETGVAVDVATRSVPLYAEDTVLVTSDGLLDAQTDSPALYEEYLDSDRDDDVGNHVLERVVTDDELRETVLSSDSLDAAAGGLVDLANERGGSDNVSTLLFRDGSLAATPEDVRPAARDISDRTPVEDRKTRLVARE